MMATIKLYYISINKTDKPQTSQPPISPLVSLPLSVSHPVLLSAVCIFIHYGNVFHSIGVIKLKPTQSVHS